MTTPRIPQWRNEPQEVWVNCSNVKPLGRDNEFVVHFAANGEEYVSFVPEQYVNEANCRLQAVIIAEVDGGLLVDIPAETLTSGPRILVNDVEKDTVLTFSAWDASHGA